VSWGKTSGEYHNLHPQFQLIW